MFFRKLRSAGLDIETEKVNLNYQASKAKGSGLLEKLGFGRRVVLTRTDIGQLHSAASGHLHFHHCVFCPTHWQYVGIDIHRTDIAHKILNLNRRKEETV